MHNRAKLGVLLEWQDWVEMAQSIDQILLKRTKYRSNSPEKAQSIDQILLKGHKV